jgi:hypothetical protein
VWRVKGRAGGVSSGKRATGLHGALPERSYAVFKLVLKSNRLAEAGERRC